MMKTRVFTYTPVLKFNYIQDNLLQYLTSTDDDAKL